MLREQVNLTTTVHQLLDMIMVVVAFVVSYYTKKYILPSPYGGLSTEPNYYTVLIASIVVCFVVFNVSGLYSSKRFLSVKSILLQNIKAVVISLVVVQFVLYVLHYSNISRILFVLTFLLLALLITIVKACLYIGLRHYRSKDINTRNIAIVGTNEIAKNLIKKIGDNRFSGYKIIGCLSCNEENVNIGEVICDEVRLMGAVTHYKSFLLETTVDELILATHPITDIPDIVDVIHYAEVLGVGLRIVPDFQLDKITFEAKTAKIRLQPFLGLQTLTLSTTPLNSGMLLIKSVMDYFGAGIGLIALFPLFVVVGLGIKISSKGSVFFKQERCSLNGRKFKLLKFRTMVDNAEELKERYICENEMDGPVFKIGRDPRITFFGKFLRKTSLDELPQLVNVLQGHMSLVGPRPPLPDEVEKYKSWQRRRLTMKPGITGLWQVSGRNNVDFETWMNMDLEYIDQWSLWLDIKLLFLSLREVVQFTGK